MSVKQKQPSIRFDKGGPFANTGVSFLPKVVTFTKTGLTTNSTDDFFLVPAGTQIAQAFIRADVEVDGEVKLGLAAGDDEAFVKNTEFSNQTAGEAASFTDGLYLKDADSIRLTVGDTPTAGAVSGYLVYYEVDAMMNNIKHFNI